MSGTHINFHRGVTAATLVALGSSAIEQIAAKEKQFSAVLVGAAPGDTATIEIRMTPDNDKDRYIVAATLTLSAEAPSAVTEVLESLIPGHYAEITSHAGAGAVWVFGDA